MTILLEKMDMFANSNCIGFNFQSIFVLMCTTWSCLAQSNRLFRLVRVSDVGSTCWHFAKLIKLTDVGTAHILVQHVWGRFSVVEQAVVVGGRANSEKVPRYDYLFGHLITIVFERQLQKKKPFPFWTGHKAPTPASKLLLPNVKNVPRIQSRLVQLSSLKNMA